MDHLVWDETEPQHADLLVRLEARSPRAAESPRGLQKQTRFALVSAASALDQEATMQKFQQEYGYYQQKCALVSQRLKLLEEES